MENQKPTVGRIVNYHPTENDPYHNGADILPAVVVRVWSDSCVNLKVLNDGEQDFWRTSAGLLPEGTVNTQSGMWSWPVRI